MSELPWFDDWVVAHTARFPGQDCGHTPERLFEGWEQSFLRHRVTRAEAEAASLRSMESCPFPDAMLGALLAAVREVRGTAQDNAPIRCGPGCPLCGGTGWATAPAVAGHLHGASLACDCPAGARAVAACPRIERLADRPDLRERMSATAASARSAGPRRWPSGDATDTAPSRR